MEPSTTPFGNGYLSTITRQLRVILDRMYGIIRRISGKIVGSQRSLEHLVSASKVIDAPHVLPTPDSSPLDTPHNIIHIQQCSVGLKLFHRIFSNITHIRFKCGKHLGLFRGILSFPQNTIMDLNNGMLHLKNAQTVVKTSGTLNAIEFVGIKTTHQNIF